LRFFNWIIARIKGKTYFAETIIVLNSMSFRSLPFVKPAYQILIAFILFGSIAAIAQPKILYTYQDLSKTAYSRQKDSLKKNWVCPAIFEQKPTQKKYKELWDSRTNYLIASIDNNNYVRELDVFNYVNSILSDIVKSNPKSISTTPLLFIDRSSAVNAYAIGGNIIAVNLGLINFAQSREEVALVIAHELSHNILQHPDNAMKEEAEWFTSDEYKNSLNAVLDSRYERLTRLKKLFQGYKIDRSKHHRYHESDADSLAIILLKNSHIGFDARFFLRLDSADMQFKQSLKKPVKEYFTNYNLAFEDWWTQKRTKGLSTKSYNFKDTASIQDSLKTHPDCSVRYAATLSRSDGSFRLTPVPPSIKEKASRIIIWNLFDNLDLTACLYEILLQKDRGITDEWYDFMMHNVMAGLYYSDKQLNRFHAVGIVPKETVSKDYYELQNMLEQIPKDKLELYYKAFLNQLFWKNLSSDANGLKALMSALNLTTESSDSERSKAAKNFISSYSTSMYCEFADHFTLK